MSVRILQVIGGSQFGGAVWVILAYSQALLEHGCEVTVCTSVESVAEVFRNAGCQIVSVPEMVRAIDPRKDVPAVFKLARLCRAGRYDVVHTHTSKGGFIGRAAARLAGVRIVLHTAHGFAFHEGSSRRSIAFYTALERLAARWCDRLITVSEFHRQWAIRLGIASPEKVVTIRNGISRSRLATSRTRTESREAFGFDEHDVVLGFVGRLAPQKGLEALIGALPAILKRDPRVRLLIAGDGPSRSELSQLAERGGVSSKIRILGFQTTVGDVLNSTDIVVAPSIREGLSISILESMAMGKPTIATNIGSNRELIEDRISGRLVPPNEVSPLIDAILELAAEPELARRYGDAAARHFEKTFTEEAMKDALWGMYRELLVGHSATAARLATTP